jgi:hypothetical protein
MTKHVCVTLCLLGQVFAFSARAETLGGVEISPAEKRACAPDVIRLCRNFMPDQTAVFGCMQDKRALLSSACDKVARARGL